MNKMRISAKRHKLLKRTIQILDLKKTKMN